MRHHINNLFLYLLLITCYLLFLFVLPLFAQDIPVNIKAENLKYIEETKIIEATGKVEIKLKEIIIYADKVSIDSETNIATAEGRVLMIAKDYQARSDKVRYDANTQFSTFSNFSSQLSPSRIKGSLFVSSGELVDLRNKMLGEDGLVTTCEYKIPHFFFTADKIEYYPDDKIVGRNVYLFAGKLPVWFMPYMVYDLSKKREKNWVFGHNQVEGDFIKSSWGYPYGILYVDLMQKKGLGLGSQVPYALGALGAGSLYLYHLQEKDTHITDWVTRINHTKQLNSATTLKLSHDYSTTYLIPSGRRDQTRFGMDLGFKDSARWNLNLKTFDDRIASLQKYSLAFSQAYQKISTNYNFNYDFSKSDPKWIRASQRFQFRRPLFSDRVMLTTRASYYNNVADSGEPGDERLEPFVEIVGREKKYSWRFTENFYIDLDEDSYLGDDSFQYLEKKPEIVVFPKALDFTFFKLAPSFGYGHYHEVAYVSALAANRDFSTERYQATLDAKKSLKLGLGTTATLLAGIDQFLYGPGDQMYTYRESAQLSTDLFDFFKNSIYYRKGKSDGNTPFLFDQLSTNYHSLVDTMTFYYLNKVRLTLDSGHNWQTHTWFDVNGNLLFKPSTRLSWRSRLGWDIENKRYKNLINSLSLSPSSFLDLTFSSVSDINTGNINSGSILYDLFLLRGQLNQWHFRLSQVYESGTGQFKVRDIIIVKDLHCWELQYTYSDFRKEFSISFSLKALPDEPIGMSSGRGFYMESLEKEIKGLKKEGSIKRY
ncbi:MAG: LPS-assembly protein LptD [Candidatus Saganbacteria bacterium]|nr:LPS-assembly protein LptD [Candidatus Saganbacteria bacterium]